MKQNELSERLWNFAARADRIVDALPGTRLGRPLAGQPIRRGTSAPSNYDAGGAAESRSDFVPKLSVALKELRATRGWLRFVVLTDLRPQEKMSAPIDEAEPPCRIPGKPVVTAKRISAPKPDEILDSRF